jgi:hypothetical protein
VLFFQFLVPTLFPNLPVTAYVFLFILSYFLSSVVNAFWKAILMQNVTSPIKNSSFWCISDILSFFDCLYFFYFGATFKMGPRSPYLGFLDHTNTHTQNVGLIWTRDQPVAAVPPYTTRRAMLSGGFEAAFPAL